MSRRCLGDKLLHLHGFQMDTKFIRSRPVQPSLTTHGPARCPTSSSSIPLRFRRTLAFQVKRFNILLVNLTIKLHDCSVDGETGYAAVCAEFPEANGQGETREQCLHDLRTSIEDILAYRREEAQKSVLRGEKLETMPA